ncbi:MAG: hypothetical protein HW388_193 [Dehalococcoidia bacterium]|nr:hypothetical protein [Dehalococcoidia bacterium]
MIRTLRATDLLRLLIVGNSGIGPDWAQTWEKVGARSGSALSPSTVARGLVLRRATERYSVWVEGARLRALASVRARSGPRAWEVRCLHLSLEAEEEGVDLLEGLCVAAGQQGGERVFLRLPTSSPVVKMVMRAGFLPYAQETLYRRENPPSTSSSPTELLRPYISSDEHDLFRLYNACVPANVKTAYALTFEEWRDAREPLGRWERQWVYEAQGHLRGWVRVASGKQPAYRIELMVHPGEEPRVWEQLVVWGLQQRRPQGPSLALVPSHQPILVSVLGEKGFAPAGEYRLMVKSIVVRVKESTLAPAGA